MVSVSGHCAIKIVLSSLFSLGVIISLTCSFYSFSSFAVGLRSLKLPLEYEDVKGEVYASFGQFQGFACKSSQEVDINTLCSNISSFEAAGILYLLFCVTVLGGLFVCILKITLAVFMKRIVFKQWWLSDYLVCPVYLLGALSFLIVSNVSFITDVYQMKVDAEAGIYWLFLTAGISMFGLFHHIYIRKATDFDKELSEIENLNKELLTNKDVPNIQSDLRDLLTKKEELEERLRHSEDVILAKKDKIRAMKELNTGNKAPKLNATPPAEEIRVEPALFPQNTELLTRISELETEKRALDAKLLSSDAAQAAFNSRLLRAEQEKASLESRLTQAVSQLRAVQQELSESQLLCEVRSGELGHVTKSHHNQKERLAGKEESLELAEKRNWELQDQLNRATLELSETTKRLKERDESVSQLKTENREAAKKSQDTLEELQQAQDSITRLQRPSASDGSSELLRHDNSLLQERTNKLTESLKNEREARIALELAVEDLKSQNHDLNSQLNEIREQLALLTGGSPGGSAQSYLSELKKQLRKLGAVTEEKEDSAAQLAKTKQALDDTKYLLKSSQEHIAELKKLSEEAAKDKTELEQLRSSRDFTSKQHSQIKERIREQEEEWEHERDQLLHSLTKQKKQNDTLRDSLKARESEYEAELQQKINTLDRLKDELRKFQIEKEIAEKEHSRLSHFTESLKQQLGDQHHEPSLDSERELLHGQIQELQKNLEDSDGKLTEILGEKESLRSELNKKTAELQEVSEECQRLQNKIYETEERKSPEDDFSITHSSFTSSRNVRDYGIIDSVAPNTHQNNLLLRNVSRLRREPPMTNTNVFKLFETLMQEKSKQDAYELDIRRQPRTMTEYMLDFMNVYYGLKSLALKQLKSLIASLENLYRVGHPYGILFCRFLGLFHPRPLPDNVSIYLLSAKEMFSVLSHKVKDRPASFSEQYELLQYGGQASIVDVMELVSRICRHNRDAGERILTEMTRERQDRLGLVVLKVCATMARMGKTPDYIFEMLRIDKGGSVQYSEFINCLRLTLNIWVTQEETDELCVFLDEGDSGLVSYQDWLNSINFIDYADKVYSKLAMITKCDFLNALVEEYEFEVVEDYHELRQMIRLPVLQEEALNTLLLQLDPTLEAQDLHRLYIEAKEQDREPVGGITPDAACIVILKNRIGGYGVGMFDIYNLDPSLPKTSTEGVKTELVVERNVQGKLEVDLRKKSK